MTEERVSRIRNLCTSHRGKSPLNMTLETASGYRVTAVADVKLSVRPDTEFCRKMKELVGAGNVRLRRR